MNFSNRKKSALWILLHLLIILDILLITIALIFDFPTDMSSDIFKFDFSICIILLIEWFYNLYKSESKTKYLTRLGN